MIRKKLSKLLQNPKYRTQTLRLIKMATQANQAKWVAIFDSLKKGQIVEVWAPSVMGGGTNDFYPFKVGRKSFSAKYNVEKLRLDPVSGPKKPAYASHFLYKKIDRRTGDPKISAAVGDMGLTLKGLRKA